MSLTDKFEPRPVIARSGGSQAISERLRLAATLFVAVVALAVLALLFAAGHPFLASWVALILIGWLFIAGAAKASDG